MNAAFLFNSDDPKYGGVYGWDIRDTILSLGILQESDRHMKISVGDVLIFSHAKTRGDYINLAEKTYFWHPWKRLFADKIRSTYFQATIYAWVIQNITAKITEKIHHSLTRDSSYLGAHAIEFSYPLHLALYRNSMIPKYRIYGRTCNIFFSMGNEDDKDESEAEEIAKLGFDNVFWEDYGARQTIFDDFDTLEHFQQVKDFSEVIASHLAGGEDEAGELAMLMEDLNPRLFNTLGAAVRALTRAQTEEDVAHVGLSGRRYLEQLADVLFPARSDLYNGRKVTKDRFKNRLWAYVDDAILTSDPDRDIKIEALGKEVDRLIEEFNSTLHGDPDRNKVMQSLSDLAKLSIALLTLNTESARKPYYAFEKSIRKFTEGLINRSRTLGN